MKYFKWKIVFFATDVGKRLLRSLPVLWDFKNKLSKTNVTDTIERSFTIQAVKKKTQKLSFSIR